VNRSTLSNGAKLFGSGTYSQALLLCATALSARWLSPSEFATSGLIIGMSVVINSFNSLSIETRISILDEAILEPMLNVGLFIACAFSLLMVVLSLGSFTIHWGASVYLATIAMCTLALSLNGLGTSLAIRYQDFRTVAKARIMQATTNSICLVCLAITTRSWWAIVGSWGLALVASSWTLFSASDRRKLLLPTLPTRAEVRLALDIVKIQPITSLLSSLTVQGSFIVLPLVSGAAVAGTWALLGRMFGGVSNAITAMIQPLYVGKISHSVRHCSLETTHRNHRQFLKLSLACGSMSVVLLSCAVLGLGFVLGDEWERLTSLLWIAAIFYGAQMVTLPVHQALVLVGELGLHFRLTIARNALSIAALLAGVKMITPMGGLVAWSVVTAVGYVGLLIGQLWWFGRLRVSNADHATA
jgi:O-antigen/teichoic acid export membrane protein